MKFIYTIIVLLLATTAANAYEIIEIVTEVIDGDTFKTTERGKPVTVRIADIDCPELQQPGGQEAKQFTTKTLLGTLISIKPIGKKQNGILAAKVTTNRGKSMAVLLIQKGLAWTVPKTKNNLVTSQHKIAKSSKVGIWARNNPEPPWNYRKRTQKKVAPPKTAKVRSSLYGDNVTDILKNNTGTTTGKGGGFVFSNLNGTPSAEPTRKNTTETRSSSQEKTRVRSSVTKATTVISRNPVCRHRRSKAERDIKAALMDRYDSHYSTISMLFDSNMEAYGELCNIQDTAVSYKILSNLERRYYPHFNTILMLYKSNIKAYNKLNK